MLVLRLIGLVTVAVWYAITSVHGGRAALGSTTRRLEMFAVDGNPHDVLQSILRFARQSRYHVAALDEHRLQLVLSAGMNLLTCGFFAPVALDAMSDGKTLVRVGIKSKVGYTFAPIISRSHQRCIDDIKTALRLEGRTAKSV